VFGVVVGVVSENSIVTRVHKFFEGLTVVDIGRGSFGIVDEFSFCIGIIVFIGPERFAAFLTAFGGVRFEAFRMFSSFNFVVLLAVGGGEKAGVNNASFLGYEAFVCKNRMEGFEELAAAFNDYLGRQAFLSPCNY